MITCVWKLIFSVISAYDCTYLIWYNTLLEDNYVPVVELIYISCMFYIRKGVVSMYWNNFIKFNYLQIKAQAFKFSSMLDMYKK